jgi:hypothetical protein
VKIKNVIKRQVLSTELLYAWQQVKARIEQVPPVVSQEVLGYRRQLVQIGSFAAAGFILIAVLQSLSFLSSAKKASGEILGAATSAYTDLHSAGENITTQNFAAAGQLFVAAENNIAAAQNKLSNFRALTWAMPQANSADHILAGAGYLAEAGKNLTVALNLFDDLKVSSKGVQTENFSEKILANRKLLSTSRDLVVLAAGEFNSASSLPLDYSDTLSQAKQQVSDLNSILDKLIGLEDLYLGFFDGQKTYLLIFQNYDEARATGGFVGTYGVLRTDRGSITKLKIESIYELDGQIYEQISAPGPFQPEVKRWGIRDANWFVDFPTSAQKLLYFFEKGGETADGIISATPKTFENILSLTGPIDMPEYGVTLTPDNFQQIVQYKTSVDYDKILNQPKKLLADFAPILLDRLTSLKKDQWFSLFQIFEDNLRQRQILLYSKDQNTQTQIENMGFDGKILSTDYDYLSINNSNLGGTKTDLSVNQQVSLKSKILSDGSIINTLAIDRKNSAEESNKDYLRILVPLGSQFISATGLDDYLYFDSVARGMRQDPDLAKWDRGELHSNVYVRTEGGKTEFAGWVITNSGRQRSIIITYMLPFKIDSAYSLLLQKQSGSKSYNFAGSLSLGRYRAKWTGPGIENLGSTINFKSETNMDDFWPTVVSK